MRFENDVEVAGRPSEVIEKLDDLPLMASFVPGASVGAVNANGSYPGTLIVSFGPKRIAFKGTIAGFVDRTTLSGELSGNATADIRGAKMAVTMTYRLAEVPDSEPPATRITFVSEAEMTGVLAEFAKAGGMVIANAILVEFAQRFSSHFTDQSDSGGPAPEPASTLSAASLLPAFFRTMVHSLRKSVGKLTTYFGR